MRNPGAEEKTCLLMHTDPDITITESLIVPLHALALSFSFPRFLGSS